MHYVHHVLSASASWSIFNAVLFDTKLLSAEPLAYLQRRPNGMGDGWRLGDPVKPVKAPLPRSLRSRLLLDCMGHFSDIVKQIRGRVKPDGMVMVVGSCAEGEYN